MNFFTGKAYFVLGLGSSISLGYHQILYAFVDVFNKCTLDFPIQTKSAVFLNFKENQLGIKFKAINLTIRVSIKANPRFQI